MDIVYASLTHRRRAVDQEAAAAEVGELVDVLWAHSSPGDHLEHVGGQSEPDRVDLLLYLLPSDSADRHDSAEQRAATLLHRAYLASPFLQHFYLPPPVPAATRPDRDRPVP